jgi:mycothiol synthase
MDATSNRPMTELELVFRSYRGEPDAVEMARVSNAANRAEGVDQHNTVEELVNFFSHPGEHFDGARDVVMVEHEGTVVGYGWHSWVDTTDGLRESRLGGYVHPEWTHRGIGRQLLKWLEARARASVQEHPTRLPTFYGSWADEKRVGKRALLEREGYTTVRWFYEMRRDGLDVVEVPPMPEGLEIRPMGSDRASLRRLFDADAEAFQDHWGGFASDDSAFEEWASEPSFEPSLFVVAWDGNEIAGAVINAIPRAENEAYGRKRGWLESVWVRRPWRRRGLAQALVARSLVALRERGIDHAMLGVDADNPTGAVGVYERAGFVVAKRSTAYRKPMEAGT